MSIDKYYQKVIYLIMAQISGSGSALGQLEDTLELYLVKKAPALPENIKELLVKLAPWITLILLIISLPAVLFLLGVGTVLMPFAYLGGAAYGTTYTISMVVLAVSLVLEALAIPGLFKRTKSGWNLVFYSSLVSLVSSLIMFNVVSGIISALIGLYILFQIRSHYH